MKKYLLITCVFLCIEAKAQTFASPSLSVGVGKVLYEKGSLDAALVAELIASKQDEVKREITKRWIQNSVSGGSYVVKNFIAKNMEVLLSGSSVDVVKKEMLKNAAELALVLGVAEFYLQDLHNRCHKIEINDYSIHYPADTTIQAKEIDFILDYGRSLDPENRIKFFKDFFHELNTYDTIQINSFKKTVTVYRTSLPGNITKKNRISRDSIFYHDLSLKEKILLSIFYYNIRPFSEFDPFTNWSTDSKFFDINFFKDSKTSMNKNESLVINELKAIDQESGINNYLPQPILINTYKNKQPYSSERKGKTKFWSPNHMLLDLVFFECINSNPIKQLGYFHNLNANLQELQSMNMLFRNDDRTYFLRPIQSIIKSKIDYVFNYYAIFGALREVKSIFESSGSITTTDDEIKKIVDQAQIAISNTRNLVETYLPTSGEEEVFKNLYRILSNDHLEPSILNDHSSYLKNQVLPLLTSLNLKTNSTYGELQIILEELSKELQAKAIEKLEKAIFPEGQGRLRDELKKYDSYIQLAQTVSRLDKIETYDKIIKFISDIGGIYSDRGVGAVVNSFVNAYDKYVILIKDENRLQIDVEAAAADLYNRYTKNARSNFGLLFTVGVNYAHQNYWMPQDESTGVRPHVKNDITFVSEKIGLKYRVWNYSKRKSLGYQSLRNYTKPTNSQIILTSNTPLVTDIHAIAYGSGLLYQISELNSNSGQLSKPIAGLSLGVSFFNGLDLNAGVAAEIGEQSNLFYNVSFDINFTEYLTALRKKKSN
jgi:hypothetical protein